MFKGTRTKINLMFFLGLFSKKDGGKLSSEEFETIFLELYPALCLYALKFVGEADEAKDIVQDVFERFWNENDQLINKLLMKTYLYKAVKNRALNYKKRESRLSRIDGLFSNSALSTQWMEDSDGLSILSFSELQKDIEDAINELPLQRQIIFRLSRFQNMKHKEIAEELNIAPKTVETQIYRSLIFLKNKLRHHLNHK